MPAPAAAPKPEAVYFHAWKHDGEDQTYCEADDAPDGWCVYTRYADDTTGPDLSDEHDFPDRTSAIVEVQKRAHLLAVETREY